MGPANGPLKGIRILDFTWGKAGPTATMILSDMGAEVIKVEGPERPDGSRGLPPRLDQLKPLENSGYFNNNNRNKKGVVLNMALPEARAIGERLVAKSDVVIESFSAHVMDSWGLGYARLKEIRPDIIYVSMAGLGHWGPQAEYQTIGPTIQALSGLTWISGLPDKEPAGWGYSYMDNTGGYYGAIAVLFALLHRARTGRGQWIDLAQVEAATTLTGTAILDYTVNGGSSTRNGNRSEHPAAAPHGIYACAGEDRWCAIAVFNDAEWLALTKAMDRPELARDERFCTQLRRYQHQDELDQYVSDWTRQREPHAVMGILQAAGIAAGAVQTGRDLSEDPQLAHLGFYWEADHPLMGSRKFEGLPLKFSRTPAGISRGSPMLGEMSREVLRDVLEIDGEQIDRLAAAGAIQG